MSDVQDLIKALSMGRHGLPSCVPGEPVPQSRLTLAQIDLEHTAWVFHRVQLYDPANTYLTVTGFDAPYWTGVQEARITADKPLNLLSEAERDRAVLRTAAGIPYTYPPVSGIPGHPGRGLGIFPSWVLGYDYVDVSKNARVRRMFAQMYCSS